MYQSLQSLHLCIQNRLYKAPLSLSIPIKEDPCTTDSLAPLWVVITQTSLLGWSPVCLSQTGTFLQAKTLACPSLGQHHGSCRSLENLGYPSPVAGQE